MSHNYKHMYDLCKTHMHSYVLADLNDGTQVDGIITGVDDEYVYLAVPIEATREHPVQAHPEQDARYGFPGAGFGFPGYGFPGYGYPGYGFPGYGFGYGPGRRFRRLVLPLAALTAISALPWY